MKLRTEKNFKILAILFLIVPQVVITTSFLINCDDEGQCDEPIRYLGVNLTQNLISISGVYLGASLLGAIFGIVSIISLIFGHEIFPHGIVVVGLIPWLSIILINALTRDFSRWRILYGWVVVTQIAYITFWIHPFPLSPV